ncbi:hypothetical protein [Haladaptatus sp. DJG-WS-42]|uniref:hypothetical protein n=1 Tax=Haladaptatus sp. DJG-WS-42 TaxID=3120516 RepID=UPI0030CC0238
MVLRRLGHRLLSLVVAVWPGETAYDAVFVVIPVGLVVGLVAGWWFAVPMYVAILLGALPVLAAMGYVLFYNPPDPATGPSRQRQN